MINKSDNFFFLVVKRFTFKVNASTIVETLIASLIIIIVFSIASLTLNNVFKSTIKNDTTLIQYRLNKLSYLLQNNKLSVPYFEEYKGWDISIKVSNNDYKESIVILAKKESKQIDKTLVNVGY
jgi:hypothetical protein